MNKKKFTYRILLYFSGFLVLACIAGLLLQNFLDEKIQQLFIREINKQLNTEVRVEKVKFSIFRDFPYASVRFYGVSLKESIPQKKKGDLVKAGLISLRFPLSDLFHDQFHVTNLLIDKAQVNIHLFEDGTDNYHFWKSSQNAANGNFSLDLQKIQFTDSKVLYVDEASSQHFEVKFFDALMSGKFSSENFVLEASSDILVEKLLVDNISYLQDRKAKLDLTLLVKGKEDRYELQKGQLVVNDLSLSTTGWILDRKDQQELELKIFSSESTLDQLVSIVPPSYLESLQNYTFEGDARVMILVKGAFGGNRVPAIQASLMLDKGTIGKKHSRVALEEVNMELTYLSNQDMTQEILTISGLKAKLKNGDISGSLKLEGLKSSRVTCSLKAGIDLDDARQLLDLDTITNLKGNLNLNGRFEGMLTDLKKPAFEDLQRCKMSGNIQVINGELGLKGYNKPLREIIGSARFENNNALLNTLHFTYGKSDFTLKGTLGNLMAWLIVKGQKLSIQGSVSSEKTDWDEISSSTSGSGEYNFGLPADIEIPKLQISLGNFNFRKFSASSISANLKLSNRILTATNILMLSMKGTVSGQASVNASHKDHSFIQCKATFTKVNIKSLFEEFGDFGNTDLTSKNLDGLITADVIYASSMFPNLDIDLQSVKTHAEIRVENGRLVNYEPMKGLSKFLRVEDLADIRFQTLQNQIDIANRIIYIPTMKIQSSAINLSLMGTHTFDNELDYHFSLALADLLSSKFHRKNPTYDKQSEFGPVEDDNRGRTMVYVSMTGTVDEPVFAYDKKAVREKLNNELKVQKTELKEAFKREFGSMSGDTLRKAQDAKEKAIRKKQEEGKFVIEWDEDQKKK